MPSPIFNSTLIRNLLGLVFISLTWIVFSVIGLRGQSFDKPIKQIRQEAGISMLTLAVFTLSLLGLIALFSSNPIPS